jgi:putative PIN family toxin of toxin-antitoxin system
MIVVLNTNVWVSAYAFKQDASREILRRWRKGLFDIAITPSIFLEYQDVLKREKFDIDFHDAERALEEIASRGILIGRPPRLYVDLSDKSDIKFLECSKAAEADYLVTRDKILLNLKTFEGTRILTPERFIKVVRIK